MKGLRLCSYPLKQYISLIIASKIVIMEMKVVFSDLRAIPHSMILVPCFKQTAEIKEVLSRSVQANYIYSNQNFTKITLFMEELFTKRTLDSHT
jgi:hypothetical protein